MIDKEIIAVFHYDDTGSKCCGREPYRYAEEIIRCKECKHAEYREDFNDYECHSSGCGLVYDADFFCADGERKESE